MSDVQQTLKDQKEIEQYRAARWIVVTVIASILILVLACLAALTIVVATFLAHVPW